MSLPWFKVFGDLPHHEKSDLLEDALATPRAWTHVVELWCWVSKVKPTGDLSGTPAAIIAKRAGWTGDPETFVAALKNVGFMDANGRLHDWEKLQGAHVRKVERDNGKPTAKQRKNKRSPEPLPDPSATPRGVLEGEEMRGEERRITSPSRSATTCAPAAEDPARGSPPPDDPPAATAPTTRAAKEPLDPGPRLEVLSGALDGRPVAELVADRAFAELAWTSFVRARGRQHEQHEQLNSGRRTLLAKALRKNHKPSAILLAVEGIARDGWWRGDADNYRKGRPPSLDRTWREVLPEKVGEWALKPRDFTDDERKALHTARVIAHKQRAHA